MIKTPVSYDDSENVFYPYHQIEDANGSFIFECKDKSVAQEIVKRINMHDELVELLKESKYAISETYGIDSMFVGRVNNALERCK